MRLTVREPPRGISEAAGSDTESYSLGEVVRFLRSLRYVDRVGR